jgi:AcrR family transcriptional regulator
VLHQQISAAEDVGRVDGRVLRGIRTRQAIVSAARDLFITSGREPTLDDIVRRAGVSPRIALKYFTGLGGVIVVMVVQVLDEVVARYDRLDTEASLHERIVTFVDLRAEVCEAFSPLWLRAVQMARHTSDMGRLVQRGREDLRRFAADTFARELRGLPEVVRRDLFDELTMVADWNNWRYLREACDRTPEEARVVLRNALRRILAA